VSHGRQRRATNAGIGAGLLGEKRRGMLVVKDSVAPTVTVSHIATPLLPYWPMRNATGDH
jgi:hypothetical protein